MQFNSKIRSRLSSSSEKLVQKFSSFSSISSFSSKLAGIRMIKDKKEKERERLVRECSRVQLVHLVRSSLEQRRKKIKRYEWQEREKDCCVCDSA